MRARVTLHGFAINCDTDLSWFDGIVACGLPDHGVTSLSELAGRDVTVGEMRPIVERHLADVFGLCLEDTTQESIAPFPPTLTGRTSSSRGPRRRRDPFTVIGASGCRASLAP